jgi:hypothetical protein
MIIFYEGAIVYGRLRNRRLAKAALVDPES